MPLVSFSSGQVISSANVNANFGLCVLTDTSRTVTVTHTWSASQTFSGGASFGAAITSDLIFTDATYDLGKTGATRPRDGFFSRNLVAGGTLNVSGVATLSTVNMGALTVGNNGSGFRSLFYSSADQYAVGVTRSGNGGACYFFGASSSGSVPDGIFSNNAGTELFRMTDGGTFKMATAASKFVPGATSLTFRNNADTQDNVAITDAGNVTVGRGDLTVSIGNFIITGVAGTVQIGGNQVIGPRLTGYTNAWTGAAANKATGYDASTITLPQLAARVRALQESLTSHGLIAA